MNSANIPRAATAQVAPPSRVRHAPPQLTPTTTSSGSLGCTQIEWIAGRSAPPPNQPRREGWSQSPRTSDQRAPSSSLTKRPPPTVPHQSAPGRPPAARAHTCSTRHGQGLPSAVVSSSGEAGAGKHGVVDSRQLAPPSSLRRIFTPKCPVPRAACSAPVRASASTWVTASPMKWDAAMRHPAGSRRRENRPLRVAT
jgi:hypothetical protein